jgi:hypothetical protein
VLTRPRKPERLRDHGVDWPALIYRGWAPEPFEAKKVPNPHPVSYAYLELQLEDEGAWVMVTDPDWRRGPLSLK